MAATPTPSLGFQNFFQATLTGDITASSTDILMDNIPNASQGFLVIEPDSTSNREVIFYTSKTALKVVCPSAADGRGQDDTTAGAHSTGATVIMAPVAGFWEAFQSGRAFTNNVINTSKLKTASEFIADHVASGIVITGDSLGVNKDYSISSGVVYIAGERCTVDAVSAQTVGASKDRYIDLRSNGDGTASYITNEVANNAASQALVAGDLRVGIVVAGATTIANAGSINQGQTDKVLPIASSIPYAVTDSLGNLICPRDSRRCLLGYRQLTAAFTIPSALTDVTGANVTVQVPENRRVRVSFNMPRMTNTSGATREVETYILEGTTVKAKSTTTLFNGQSDGTRCVSFDYHPSAGTQTYKIQMSSGSASNVSMAGTSNYTPILRVELI